MAKRGGTAVANLDWLLGVQGAGAACKATVLTLAGKARLKSWRCYSSTTVNPWTESVKSVGCAPGQVTLLSNTEPTPPTNTRDVHFTDPRREVT